MKAPNFSLPDQDGVVHNLSDYVEKWLVIYFYPKDDTPGCTTEACSFRDGNSELLKMGVQVIGISDDSVKSHKKFQGKYNLNFPILSDESHTVIEAFGAWAPKKLFGKEFLGTRRNTYIINPTGEIVKTYENVDPSSHTDKIITDLKELQGV